MFLRRTEKKNGKGKQDGDRIFKEDRKSKGREMKGKQTVEENEFAMERKEGGKEKEKKLMKKCVQARNGEKRKEKISYEKKNVGKKMEKEKGKRHEKRKTILQRNKEEKKET